MFSFVRFHRDPLPPGGGERGQLLQPQDDPPDSSLAAEPPAAEHPIAASWNFKSSGIAHALARASSVTKESASALGTAGAVGMRMLPPGQSQSFAWAAVQGKGRAVRLADGKPVGALQLR
jgi:hypothetical protein